jgi:hypothetical protein
VAAGIAIDKYGRISWQPTTANVGNHPIVVTVTDSNGAKVTQTYNLSVIADTVAPTINLVRETNIANIGDTISFQVQATDNVGIKSRQLLVNGEAISIDSNGVGTYTVKTPGVLNVQALVTDINGNTSTANTTVNVLDPSDSDAPQIALKLPEGNITNFTDIIGTVTDTNLDYYVLEVALLGSNDFKEIFRGTKNVTDGVLGKFDPSLLSNDTYTVRLTAFDVNGQGSVIEDTIDIAGELKLGNFRLK